MYSNERNRCGFGGLPEEAVVGILVQRATQASCTRQRRAVWHPNQLRKEMKRLNPFSEWLLRFTASQKNVDRVAIWLGGTVSVLCIVSAVAFVIYMLLR